MHGYIAELALPCTPALSHSSCMLRSQHDVVDANGAVYASRNIFGCHRC